MMDLTSAAATPTGARISGIGAYRPVRVIDNEEMVKLAGLSPTWIRDRSGIERRHHAGPEETIVMMATEAGSAAVADAGLKPTDIDLVVLATASRNQTMPGGAPEVASRMGIRSPGAFDLNAVCAGFTYALSMVTDAVRLGAVRHALVIGSERMTDWTTPDLPEDYMLFADGAGAAVVSRADRLDIGPAVWGSDGNRSHVLGVPPGSVHISMDGPLVYRWAVGTVPEAARLACRRAGADLADLDWLVVHQANGRIIKTIAKELGLPAEKVSFDVADRGNTSAASIPLALVSLRESGLAKSGQLALLFGFGAGLTYAGQAVRLP